LYEKYKNDDEVMLLSHTLDPEHDDVVFLKEYATKLGIEDNYTWHFVTGDKKKIYELAEESYFVTAVEDENEPGGIAHNQFFVLVDGEGRIRGFYDGSHHMRMDDLKYDLLKLLDRKKDYDSTLIGKVKWLYYRCTGGE
ncbi:MAG: SCO family protein, partial [Cytophagales bacterium]|nr:SCO family protein [Cytophagales bacterium]